MDDDRDGYTASKAVKKVPGVPPGGFPPPSDYRPPASGPDAEALRRWLAENGYPVPDDLEG
jgi:hypothetical protein